MATRTRCIWQLLFVLVCSSGLCFSRHLHANVFAQPDYTMYHRKDVLLQEVQQIVAANPRTMSMEMRKMQDASYSVDMQIVTVETAGLNSSSPSSKVRMLLDFGEHGREFITSELGLQLMRTLADPNAIKAVVGGGERGDKLVQLVQGVIFKILPMENVNGRAMAEAGKLCERKNGRGVDTNRNWEVDWGKKEKDYDPNEEYPGTAPFSEPEVKIILDIARTLQPHVWLNIHSGMEAMFTPWDHKAEIASGAQPAFRILQTIYQDLFTKTGCVVGSGGKSVGYLAHGTATDFMYEKLKVPLPFTWEIYGDFKADFHDCFRMFNPVDKQQFQTTIDLWLKAIFRLIELLPTHSAVAPVIQLQQQQQQKKEQPQAAAQQPASAGGDQKPVTPAAGAATGGVSSTPTKASATPAAQPATASPAQQRQDSKQEQPSKQQQVNQQASLTGPAPAVNPNALYGIGQSQLWVNAVLGVGGLAVVGVLVYRLVQGQSSQRGSAASRAGSMLSKGAGSTPGRGLLPT